MVRNPAPARSSATPRMSGFTPNSSCATITPTGAGAVAGRARYAGKVVPSSTAILMVVMVPIVSFPDSGNHSPFFTGIGMSTLGTMTSGGDSAALGQLLRSRRERLVPADVGLSAGRRRDRKSTRLNSSHMSLSYAVFCLKKKKKNKLHTISQPNTHKNKKHN